MSNKPKKMRVKTIQQELFEKGFIESYRNKSIKLRTKYNRKKAKQELIEELSDEHTI